MELLEQFLEDKGYTLKDFDNETSKIPFRWLQEFAATLQTSIK